MKGNKKALNREEARQKQILTYKDNAPWWRDSVILFARLSSWIGLPIILAALLGHWLDKKLNTDPWFFLVLIALSFAISLFGLIIETSKAYRQIIKTSDKTSIGKASELKNKKQAVKQN